MDEPNERKETVVKLVHSAPPSGRKTVGQETRQLPVPLTQEELLKKGDELAAIADKQTALKNEFDQVKAKYKDRAQHLEAERLRLSEEISTRKENRPVLVEQVVDYDRQQMLEVRTDSMETLRSRPLTIAELQGSLDLPGIGESRLHREE